MQIRYSRRFLAAATVMLLLGVGSLAEAETVKTRIGELHFELGVPTKETVTKLYDEMASSRTRTRKVGTWQSTRGTGA
jgi:hypothetical protein